MRAARADDNQKDIVAALRGVGATVTSLHRVGMGCPDILVGYRGINHLMEIKDGSKVPSAQKLTPMQVRWHELWRGEVIVVRSVGGALGAIGVSK